MAFGIHIHEITLQTYHLQDPESIHIKLCQIVFKYMLLIRVKIGLQAHFCFHKITFQFMKTTMYKHVILPSAGCNSRLVSQAPTTR